MVHKSEYEDLTSHNCRLETSIHRFIKLDSQNFSEMSQSEIS